MVYTSVLAVNDRDFSHDFGDFHSDVFNSSILGLYEEREVIGTRTRMVQNS